MQGRLGAAHRRRGEARGRQHGWPQRREAGSAGRPSSGGPRSGAARRAKMLDRGGELGGRRRRQRHTEKEAAARSRVEVVIDKDPTDEIICTNLKQWKVGKKKKFERYIGLAPNYTSGEGAHLTTGSSIGRC